MVINDEYIMIWKDMVVAYLTVVSDVRLERLKEAIR
jgi:hypothetical protein